MRLYIYFAAAKTQYEKLIAKCEENIRMRQREVEEWKKSEVSDNFNLNNEIRKKSKKSFYYRKMKRDFQLL